MAHFEELSDDILYLILQHLHPERSSSLHCLRLMSARLNAFAESVLYRNIILEDDDQHGPSSYRFIERLSSRGDPLSKHVRSLQVKSFKGDDRSFCMNTKLIAACLNGLDRLDSFSWDSDVLLDDELLEILHRRFPEAQLCAAIKTLDQALLSSPQLCRLSVSLPDLDPTHHQRNAMWEQLKQILLHCRTLRALTIDVHPDRTARPLPTTITEGDLNRIIIESRSDPQFFANVSGDKVAPMSSELASNTVQIPFEPGDKLPTLEELDIRAKTYNLDAEHCARLLRCMNWRKLRRLRLGPSDPKTFFEVYKDKLPQLETLEFTYVYEDEYYIPYQHYKPKLSACADFVASITELKELVVRCDTINLQDSLWASLIQAHGAHLRRLSIQARYPDIDAPSYKGELGVLFASLPRLTNLDLALRTNFPNGYGCYFCPTQRHALSTNYVGVIPAIPSLRSLQISVRVNPCDQSLYSYIADHAHCAILKVWTTYANAATECQLETFNMTFWRWEPTSPHPDSNGFPRNAHITKLDFESKMSGGRLMIKPRGHRKVPPVYYSQVLQEAGDGLLVQFEYVPEQRYNLPEAPFIVSSRFYQALGSLFQQPANGTRLMRYREN